MLKNQNISMFSNEEQSMLQRCEIVRVQYGIPFNKPHFETIQRRKVHEQMKDDIDRMKKSVSTRVCSYGSSCKKGKFCTFAHSLEQWAPCACKYNVCRIGNCRYIHQSETKEQCAKRQGVVFVQKPEPIHEPIHESVPSTNETCDEDDDLLDDFVVILEYPKPTLKRNEPL